jgi:catechol 2,3-dioxygenase-like lactoylglutathione lyase family enzyme
MQSTAVRAASLTLDGQMVCNGAMAPRGSESTNTEFELRGFNHLALVARDMAETVQWYEDVLGMKLVKTMELPGGRGQHFFLDMGNGIDGIAFFWFANAPEGEPGTSLQGPNGMSASGTMNHLAFDVPAERFDEYREKLKAKGVKVTYAVNHADSLDGGHKADYDPATDDGDVFVRSIYFRDPNGTTLEFACWTKQFGPDDVQHAPATAAGMPVDA